MIKNLSNSKGTSWIPQFGLYRDQSDKKKKLSTNKRSYMSICTIIGVLCLLSILIFLYLSNILSDGLSQRYIIIESVNSNNATNSEEFNLEYDHPNGSEKTENDGLEDLQTSADESHSVSLEYRGPRLYPIYREAPRFVPIMRRKFYDTSFDVPRPFDYVVKGTPPSAFLPKNHSSVSFPQIPKDYVGNVKNIQDILQQIGGGGSETSTIGPKKIKIGGTYRHRKDNDAPRIFGNTVKHYSGTYPLSTITGQNSMIKESYKDPFYPFKPQSPGEINMLATSQFQFVPPAWSNKLGASPTSIESEALRLKYMKNLYQQYLKYNQNKFFWDNMTRKQSLDQEKKQKPLSLMLDVFAMPPDDESPTTQPPPLPIKYRNPFFPMPYMYQATLSHPLYNAYFQNMNFAQLQKQRFPDAAPYLNKMYLQKMMKNFRNQSTRHHNQVDQLDHSPNQITVHLNLYPKNNKHEISKMRNVEILNDHDLDPIHIASAERTTSNYKLEKDHILTTRSTIYNKSLTNPDEHKTDNHLKSNEISLKTTDTHLKPSDLITLAEVFRKYYKDPKDLMQKNQHQINVNSYFMVSDNDSLKADSTESSYIRHNVKQLNRTFNLDADKDKFIPIIKGVSNIGISNNPGISGIKNGIPKDNSVYSSQYPIINQNSNPNNNNQWNQYYSNKIMDNQNKHHNFDMTPLNNHNMNIVHKLSTPLPTTQDESQWKPTLNQNFKDRYKPEYNFENVQNVDTDVDDENRYKPEYNFENVQNLNAVADGKNRFKPEYNFEKVPNLDTVVDSNDNDSAPDIATIIPIQPRIFHDDPKEFNIDSKFDYSEIN